MEIFGDAKVQLLQVSSIENEMVTLRLRHLEYFRTISVRCDLQLW
jgi:hypothetical protein